MIYLAALVLSFIALSFTAFPKRVRLEGPRLGQPANPVSNRVEVRLRCPLPFLAPDIEVDQPWRETARRWSGNRLTLELTRSRISPEPITLRTHQNRYAIPVLEVQGPKKQMCIVQCCDLLKPTMQPQLVDQFFEEMAVRKPDLLLITGDINDLGTQAWLDTVKSALWRLEGLGTRCILTAGNHDRSNWALHLRNFGPELNTHHIAYGVPILSLDSAHGRDRLTPFQWRWLESHLKSPSALIQMHHPLFSPKKVRPPEGGSSGGTLGAFQKDFVQLCQAKRVAMIFSGHWHADAVFDENGHLRDDRPDFEGPKFVTTTAIGSEHRRVTRWSQRYLGYRVIELENSQIQHYTYLGQPMASHPLGQHHLEARK